MGPTGLVDHIYWLTKRWKDQQSDLNSEDKLKDEKKHYTSFSSLEDLDLSKNKIQAIGNINLYGSKLIAVDLSANRLTEFPWQFKYC